MLTLDVIDCQYLQPQFAAAYLISDGEHAAFIDNNTAHSVPLLLATLAKRGLKPEQVDFVIVTHVHLDHAGGTSALMEACPRARLLAHPRAVRHLVDPTKLIASARQVYGDEAFSRLYGEIKPIPENRVTAMADQEEVQLGQVPLRFLHTRGHANHHFCVLAEDRIFTGDAFGLAYPALQGGGLFIFPSTSPTDFDPVEAKIAVESIRKSGATHAYPTHFGELRDLDSAARLLQTELDFSARLLDEASQIENPDARTPYCLQQLEAHFETEFRKRGLDFGTRERELLKLDLELNAQGIAWTASKKREGRA